MKSDLYMRKLIENMSDRLGCFRASKADGTASGGPSASGVAYNH